MEHHKNCRRKISRQSRDDLHKALDAAAGSPHHYNVVRRHKHFKNPLYHALDFMLPCLRIEVQSNFSSSSINKITP